MGAAVQAAAPVIAQALLTWSQAIEVERLLEELASYLLPQKVALNVQSTRFPLCERPRLTAPALAAATSRQCCEASFQGA
jgi:hypothetical protein